MGKRAAATEGAAATERAPPDRSTEIFRSQAGPQGPRRV